LLQDMTSIGSIRPAGNGDVTHVNAKALHAAETLVDVLVQKGELQRFSEIMDVTPEIARALLKRNTRNRPTVKAAIDEYAELMDMGRWRLTIEAIGVDNTGVLANGQHRLAAVIRSGVTSKFTVWLGIEPDEFEVIDQGRKRTSHHLLHIAGISGGAQRAAIVRILLMTRDWKTETIPNQVVAEKVQELGHELDRPVHWGVRFQSKNITNGTSIGVAVFNILASGASQEAVDDFFEPLLVGDGAGPIRTRLRDAFTHHGLRGSSSVAMTVKRAAATIHAWNAYRKDNKRYDMTWGHVYALPEVIDENDALVARRNRHRRSNAR
jgi:hypothetical protein